MAPTRGKYFSGSVIDSPKTCPPPVVGEIKPSSILIVVVFPEPFGPTKPQMLPIGTSKLA